MTETTSAPRDAEVIAPSSTPQAGDAGTRGKRRRPSGEPPPLPRELGRAGRRWVWRLGVVLLAWLAIAALGLGDEFNSAEERILRQIVRLRTPGLTTVALDIHALGSRFAILAIGWTVILTCLVFRRFRHLVVFLGCVLVTTWITVAIGTFFTRPRPLGVEVLGSWNGFSHPSAPLTAAATVLLGVVYAVTPRGPWRAWAKRVTFVYLFLLAMARLYLAVDHPTDAAFGIMVGVGITLVAFRAFVPTEVFPVAYRRGAKGAHLDVGGRRGEAIALALREQLGLDVASVKPFGLEGSAGSTPLRIILADAPGTTLFGKLYAKNHLRADRSYKLMRTLVYGRLEDESTFSSVRRLVQYEDYLLRLMVGAEIPTAKPYGFVEITPEREFLLVTEFFVGASEIGSATVDDAVINDGLGIVRRLWEAGLAHRDIKPANVLVSDGRVLLIDVAFAEVRPSPWRQAVDLANMMLVLALRSDAETVYDRASRQFTPEEIAEAFAATKGITLTSQLRARLREDGRDLVTQFRKMAPPSPPIRIQRWSVRRVGLTVSVLTGAILAAMLALQMLAGTALL